jgi:hypothetical protein
MVDRCSSLTRQLASCEAQLGSLKDVLGSQDQRRLALEQELAHARQLVVVAEEATAQRAKEQVLLVVA